MRLSPSLSSSLLPSSSSSSSSLVQESPTNNKRRKNKKKNKMTTTTTTTIIATPKAIALKEKKKKKKTVRFQLPLSDTHDAAAVDAAVDDGRQRESCGKRIRHNGEGHPNSNTWYTSQELKAFRADIWLTINWMVLNGISDCGDKYGDAITAMNNKHKHSSKGAGGMSLRKLNHKYKHYPFCSQGVEGRTPIGRLLKQKRRKDAVHSVLRIQKKQLRKQHEQEFQQLAATKEEDEYQQQQRRQANVKALAFVYASHCTESSSSALQYGRDTAKEVATIVDEKTAAEEKEERRQQEKKKKKKVCVSSNIVHIHSLLCDDDSDSEESDNTDNHDSDDSYSVAISSSIRSLKSKRSPPTIITAEDTLFSSPYSFLFCNNDDNDNGNENDTEDESEVEVELIERMFTSPCSSSSPSIFKSASSSTSTSPSAVVPTWMKSSLSSSLFRSSTSSTSTMSSIGLWSEMISDVIETATATTTTTPTSSPPSSSPLPSQPSPSFPLYLSARIASDSISSSA